jgi:predicted enzyme related to lactoylglutathione lyase/uncharacterized protein YciI
MKKNILSILLAANLIVFSIFFCSWKFEKKKTAEPPSLYMVEYSKGSKWDEKKEFEEQKHSQQHSMHLQKLRKEGIIHFGGRYADKGIIFIAAMSLENAKQIVNSDSAVIGKIFNASVNDLDVFYEYRAGAAVAEEASGKVTGIGGIFFKSKDVKAANSWYYDNLGLVPNDYGSMFEWRTSDHRNIAYTQWSTFSAKTKYFAPSKKDFMINYRVDNLEMLYKKLKANKVIICDTIESYEYGKFLHIMDCDSNKIELWEAVDASFTKLYDGKTTK